jgi:hypothetical protein
MKKKISKDWKRDNTNFPSVGRNGRESFQALEKWRER